MWSTFVSDGTPFRASTLFYSFLDFPHKHWDNYYCPFGRVWGCFPFGGSSHSRGRIVRERSAGIEAQGPERGHNQGSEASLLLSQAGRKKAREGSFGAQA